MPRVRGPRHQPCGTKYSKNLQNLSAMAIDVSQRRFRGVLIIAAIDLPVVSHL
jgi:hypothetical protein